MRVNSVKDVVIVKFTCDAPAGTVTLAGTLAAALVSDNETTAPPLGATPSNTTVPVDVAPPLTVVGLMLIADNAAGVTVRLVPTATLAYEAEIATVAFEETPDVVTVNVAVVAPEATVTVAGTDATAEFALERATTAPPDAAARFSVTVPTEVVPPGTEVGLRLRLDTITLLTVNVAVFEPL